MTAQRDDDLDGEFERVDAPRRALAIVPARAQLEILADLGDVAADLAASSKSAATRRAYATDWADFSAFCEKFGRAPLDADANVCKLYVSDLYARGKSQSTIGRRLAAISGAFKAAGCDKRDLPTRTAGVDEVLAGIKRKHADAGIETKKKQAVPLSDLRELVRPLGESTIDIRDRALLLVALFAGGMRRSELVGLTVADVTFVDDGALIRLRRSKTDQLGKGRTIAVSTRSAVNECPVRALKAWLARAAITDGALFREVAHGGRIGAAHLNGRAVARVLKKHVERAGFDPAKFGAHSLRSGFITSCDKAGMRDSKIMRATGHRSIMVLQGYKQGDPDAFNDNASRDLPYA